MNYHRPLTKKKKTSSSVWHACVISLLLAWALLANCLCHVKHRVTADTNSNTQQDKTAARVHTRSKSSKLICLVSMTGRDGKW